MNSRSNGSNPNGSHASHASFAPFAPETAFERRVRDATGHCWDGLPCDHPGHVMYSPEYGTIHHFR
jgi:hypothetical protein